MLNESLVIRKVSQSVLQGYLGLHSEPLPHLERQQKFESNEVGVIIQIVGQMEGQVLCTMGKETVKQIISRMICGFEIHQLDEMYWSAFQEFGNWIASGIATELSAQGIMVNITHPIIQEGNSIIHSPYKYLVVPISTEIGIIKIYIKLDIK
ncbi:chemotaxis protein CheX [Paenibacillus sp. N3.4]|uniref:chemotaxis protein CheX n=1 Tax=Paenibacillus sp. N3.4 TaxID=2603222 RepID=UPI0011CC56B9|nr:chemotaxis protein CheX [Paenibacillus sp. N3.4]TXK76603.1 chemotaxis protein CheX [Paenibacillus sp. N3.4]